MPLGRLVTLVRGNTYKSALLGQPGPVLLGLASIQRDGGFRGDSLKTYGGESTEKLLMRPGDLYVSLKDVTQSGDLLGAVARVPSSVSLGRLTQDTVRLQFDSAKYPPDLLYWALRSPEYRAYCRERAIGTTNLSLSREDFLAFELPGATASRLELVELLETLEQRIDLLRQTNATLESIAQALFKSWFIDFDPVRAKAEGRETEGMDAATAALFPAEFEESALGLIPKGWRAGSVRDVCAISDSRRVPLSGKEREARKGPYPYYGAAALMDHVDGYLFDGVHLLLGEDGSVTNPDGTPIVQYVWGKFWVNNHAHVLQGANGVSTEHLMLGLRGLDFTPYVTGAVQAKLNQGNLFRVPFLVPSGAVASAFAAQVQPLYAKLRQGAEQAAVLAKLRDALLPRLISGKLRLPEAEEALATA